MIPESKGQKDCGSAKHVAIWYQKKNKKEGKIMFQKKTCIKIQYFSKYMVHD